MWHVFRIQRRKRTSAGEVDMSEEQLRSMSEQEIRARFRYAPAYYLQAKLEKKRALMANENQLPGDAESRWETAVAEQSQWQAALPGLDILDAALSEADDSDADDADTRPAEQADAQTELTQQAILEAALEDYSTWPVLREPESKVTLAPEPASELEHKLALVLNSEPDLKLALVPESEFNREPEFEPVLEMELDLELVLDSEPSLDLELDSDAEGVPSNVTMADFGHRAPRTVPVVSVAMDRKRPNMVRVVSKSTRLAG
jgi:hypothetical protein